MSAELVFCLLISAASPAQAIREQSPLAVMTIAQPGMREIDVRVRVSPKGRELRLYRIVNSDSRLEYTEALSEKQRIYRLALDHPAGVGEWLEIELVGVYRERIHAQPRRGNVNVDRSLNEEDVELMRRYYEWQTGAADEASRPSGYFVEYYADADNDGEFDIKDIEFLERYLSEQGPAPVPMETGQDLWTPHKADVASIRALLGGMSSERATHVVRYCSEALYAIGTPAVSILIEEAKVPSPEEPYAGDFLRSWKKGRPFRVGETKLGEAYLLLIESMRRQEEEAFLQPWFKGPTDAESKTGRRRRLTAAEYHAVVESFEEWDSKWNGTEIAARPAPTLPDGITW